MFTESEITERYKRRQRIMIAGMVVGILGLFAYFGLMFLLKDSFKALATAAFGTTFAEIARIGLVLPGLAVFLASLIYAEQKAGKLRLACPACDVDVMRSHNPILKTRCCHACGQRLIEGGKARGEDVLRRWSRRKQNAFLANWLWAWPSFNAIVLVLHWLNPTAFRNCLPWLFVPGLVGTVAAFWSFARTKNFRYTLPAAISGVLFVVGVLSFWNAT